MRIAPYCAGICTPTSHTRLHNTGKPISTPSPMQPANQLHLSLSRRPGCPSSLPIFFSIMRWDGAGAPSDETRQPTTRRNRWGIRRDGWSMDGWGDVGSPICPRQPRGMCAPSRAASPWAARFRSQQIGPSCVAVVASACPPIPLGR